MKFVAFLAGRSESGRSRALPHNQDISYIFSYLLLILSWIHGLLSKNPTNANVTAALRAPNARPLIVFRFDINIEINVLNLVSPGTLRALICLTPFFLAVSAYAGFIPAATVVTPGSLGYAGVYTIGWTFTLNQSYTVDYLGFYGNPNLTENHQVAIWSLSGTALVSGTVLTTGPQSGGFYWQQLDTPVTLLAGTYVIGGLETKERYIWPANGASITFDPRVQFGEARYGGNGSSAVLTFPNLTFPGTATNPAYFGVNFATVPEPALIMLLGIGIGAVNLLAFRLKP